MENNNENQPLKDGDDNNKNKKNKQKVITIVVALLATLMLVTMFSSVVQSTSRKEIKYSKFLSMLEKGEVDEVEVS